MSARSVTLVVTHVQALVHGLMSALALGHCVYISTNALVPVPCSRPEPIMLA